MLGDNRLKPIRFHHKDEKYRQYWLYKCVCGNQKVLSKVSVTSGNTKSCGCLATEIKKNKRIPENYSEITSIILGYKRHAKRRKLEWNLSRDEIQKLIHQNCYYCGSNPSNTKTTKNTIKPLKYNGIDRKDNSKGYLIENCVPCCIVCNRAKGNMEFDDFFDWIKRLIENERN